MAHRAAVRAAGVTLAVTLIAIIIAWTPAASLLVDALVPSSRSTPPLTYGTNLALYDANDQVLSNPSSQLLLKQRHMPIIRMPFRRFIDDIDEVRALRAIQYIGAVPDVIVFGPDDANSLEDDRRVIQIVRNVYGDGLVYVEFGNEPDVAGIGPTAYATAWNLVVPALKAEAPTYRFVGPSVSGAEFDYITAFDRLARPHPDANSWHEYACSASSSDADCIAGVAGWTQHVQHIRAAASAEIGSPVPLIITEWNLDSNPDPRIADAAFMSTWTQVALNALSRAGSSGLVAAMQYCVAGNNNFELIAPDNSMTPEGKAFFQAMAAAPRTQG